ncbi:hypothetical protein [Microbacterium aerolatum]|uniref:hypothetical protein n=1 Tax=Microbacterium aerolatum TaxID=153731 RepID=UPI0011BF1A67|nr:hypothetical protein [Microbacterium aerolatum]
MAGRQNAKPSPWVPDGIAQAGVNVDFRPPTFESGAPVPMIRYTFIVDGRTLIVTSSLREASTTLDLLARILRLLTPNIGSGRAKRAKIAPLQVPVVEPSGHARLIQGLARVAPMISARDRRGELVPRLFSSGIAAGPWVDGEPPLIWLEILDVDARQPRIGRVLMDAWSAAAFRDRLFQALDSSLPARGPTDSQIRSVVT